MRTAADLQRYAASSGCTLVRTQRLANGSLVGEFQCPDADDDDPMAPARLLDALAADDGRIDPAPASLLRTLRRSSDPAAAAHAYVRSTVRFEDEQVETFQTPSHTFATGVGDCDDSERALLALVRQLGYVARFVFFLQDGAPAHVTVQVYDGGRWQWAETTIAARYGEHPFAAMKRLKMDRADLDGVPWVLVNGKAYPLQGAPTTMGRAHGTRRHRTMGDASAGGTLPGYVGSNFASVLVQWSQSIGADPLDMLKLFLSESGLQPTAYNQGGGAAGINQLMPQNYGYFSPLTVQQYLGLTAAGQVPYAMKYFQTVMANHSLSHISGRDLYWLNFLPATFVPFATDDHVITSSPSPYYTGNTGLDHGSKGYITAGDLQKALDAQPAAHPTLWPLLSQQILQTEGGVSAVEAVGIVAVCALAGVMIVRPDLILGVFDGVFE